MEIRIGRASARAIAALLLMLPGLPALAQPSPRTYVTAIPELLAQSPASDWRAIADDDIILLELASGTVAIQLASFASPARTGQWRSLIRSGYFDDSAVQRAQENYVVQWGQSGGARPPEDTWAGLPDENRFAFTGDIAQSFVRLGAVDSYAPEVGFIDSFPVGVDHAHGRAWVLHCPGVVGTVQADPATTDGGIYHYTAIGNPPRELDGRLAAVGRIIEGIDVLSTLPRGPGVYGFFEQDRYVPILRTRLASDLPESERPRFERLDTGSPTFATLLQMRAASLAKDAPASAPYPVDACSIPLPVRRVGAAAETPDAD